MRDNGDVAQIHDVSVASKSAQSKRRRAEEGRGRPGLKALK
jgi:hypothetical protein